MSNSNGNESSVQTRNLLFGLLAIQLQKITPAQIAQITRGQEDVTTTPLSRHLVDKGALSQDDATMIEAMVDEAIRVRGDDPDTTFTAFGGEATVAQTFGDSLGLTAQGQTAETQVVSGQQRADADIPVVMEHIGRYHMVREFGSGGMGRILLVRDNHIGREVALKEILPQHMTGAAETRTGAPTSELLTIPAVARFVQEARITGQLEHPSIVPVYELGYRPDGTLYYTMRLVRGRNLQVVLGETDSLQERLELLTHFLDLCQAISYAHSRGVVHRDIKPQNIMIGEFGETIVIDWGIAKVNGGKDIHEKGLVESYKVLQEAGEDTALQTMYGHALGSPYFMPPEQAKGLIDKIDERSDVYSLGAVLYTLLTGQLPFLGSTSREFLKKVIEEPPKPILEIEPDAPRELVAICERAMQKAPEKRYQTAKELTDEVRRFVSGGLVNAYEYRLSELVWRFVRKHKTFLITAGTALGVLALVLVWSYRLIVQEKEIAKMHERTALEERQKAIEAEKAEVVARKDAQRELYSANIALAERCLEERHMDAARQRLAGCPEPYRHWGWGHLQYLCNSDLTTLKAGGRFVRFIGNGPKVIVSSVDGTAALWDISTAQVEKNYVESGGYGTLAVMDAEQKYLAINTDAAIRVWDVESGEEVFNFSDVAPTENRWAHAMVLSPDGSRLAARTDAETLRVWDTGTQRELMKAPVERNMGFTIALSPDSRRLLVGAAVFGGAQGFENRFTIYDVDGGQSVSVHTLPAPPNVHAVKFSHDGTMAALGTDSALALFKVPEWDEIATRDAKVNFVESIAFSPDDKMLVAGGNDGMLKAWSTTGDEVLFNVKGHLEPIYDVVFSPDGRQIATAGSDRVIKLWDVSGNHLKTLRGHNATVFSASFNESGTYLATASYDGTTKLWPAVSDLESARAQAMDVCEQRGYIAGSVGNTIKLWDSKTGRLMRTFEGHSGKGKPPIPLVTFNPEGTILASTAYEETPAGAAHRVRLWDVEETRQLRAFDTGLRGIRNMMFDPAGRCLAVHGPKALKLFNAETGEELRVLEDIFGFVFAADGKTWATGTQDGVLTLSNPVDGIRKARFQAVVKGNKLSMAFSPNGKYFLAGSEAETENGTSAGSIVRIWDISTGESAGALSGHKHYITCISYSRDGSTIATGSADKTVRLWNADSFQHTATLRGHVGKIRGVAFTADAKRIVTASEDGTFKLWDCCDGRELLTLQDAATRTKGSLCSPDRLAFTPDGRRLFTLTDAPVLPPVVLHSFPWRMGDYPGDGEIAIQDRIEKYKREYWHGLIAEAS